MRRILLQSLLLVALAHLLELLLQVTDLITALRTQHLKLSFELANLLLELLAEAISLGCLFPLFVSQLLELALKLSDLALQLAYLL